MSILVKLMGSFFVMAVLCAGVGGLGIYGINVTNKALNEVSDVRLTGVKDLGFPDLTTEQRQQALSNVATHYQQLTDAKMHYATLPKSPDEAQMWQQVLSNIDIWQADQARMQNLVQQE